MNDAQTRPKLAGDVLGQKTVLYPTQHLRFRTGDVFGDYVK